MSPEIRAEIRNFIVGKFPGVDFSDSEDIFALGFATSLFAMQMVMFVEKNFGLVVSNEDLEMSNFRSVDAMTALVERSLSAAALGG